MQQHIQYWQVSYTKDPDYYYYNLVGQSNSSLPDSISIQKTKERHRINAPFVVIDRKTRKFISGLKRFSQDCYYGDIRKGSIKQLLLFWIDSKEVVVFHFPEFYPKSRETFIREFMCDIKRPEN